MNKKTIHEIFARWQAQNPYPRTELIYHSHFQLLVAVILSAQSTDKVVNQVTEKLFQLAPTAEKMIHLSIPEIAQIIQRLGLYQQKAKALRSMSQILVNDYQGEVPHQREALESLPGVGRKTANVVLNTAFQIPVIAVDTHIFRVSQRLGLSHGKTPLAIEHDLMKCVPKKYLMDAHHWMILHGRYVCKAKNPLCHDCIIKDLCPLIKKIL